MPIWTLCHHDNEVLLLCLLLRGFRTFRLLLQPQGIGEETAKNLAKKNNLSNPLGNVECESRNCRRAFDSLSCHASCSEILAPSTPVGKKIDFGATFSPL